MSLRLTDIVPKSNPGSHSGSHLSLIEGGNSRHQFPSVVKSSGKQVSTLFPVVKPFVIETSSLEPLSHWPRREWVVQKTLHTTWHLYPLPTANGYPTEFLSSVPLSQSLSPHPLPLQSLQAFEPAPVWQSLPSSSVLYPESTGANSTKSTRAMEESPRSLQKYLRNVLVFSCGAAVSTLLYADPLGSLKGLLMGASLATVVPTSTPDVTAFIETAQRQLYHLDRLTVQHNGTTALTTAPQGLDLASVPPPSVGTETWISASPSSLALGGETSPIDTEMPISPVPPERAIVYAPTPVEDFATPPDLPSDVPHSPAVSGVPEPLVSSPLSQLAYRANLPLPGEGGGELLGVLEQGEQSMALFKLNGTIEQVTVGESLANGATFTGTQDGKVLLQMGESTLPLAVGQSF